MSLLPSTSAAALPTQSADVYTNLSGLESIKQIDDKNEALKKVAQQFESIFVNQMLKSMREANAVFEQDSPFGGEESKFYRDMHDQQLALTLSNGKGLGIADAMYRQLSSQYGLKPDEAPEDTSLSRVATQKSTISSENINSFIQPYLEQARAQADAIKNREVHAENASISEISSSGLIAHPPLKSAGNVQRVSIADSPEEFVQSLLPKVEQSAKKLGVNPLVLIAQSALETGWGSKIIAADKGQSSNNLFNIKANSGWQGESVSTDTIEFKNGTFSKEQANFRKYASIAQSVNDYVAFIQHNPRYSEAVKSASSDVEYVNEMSQAGYATDPQYAKKILSILDRVANIVAKQTQSDSSQMSY